MEHYISKQGKKCVGVCTRTYCGAGRGGKQPGSLPGTPWLSDLWRPRCTSSSSSMQQDVCSPLLTAQPRRTKSGGASMMLTLPKPHCRDSRLLPHSAAELFSPSNPTSVHQKREKTCRSNQTSQRRWFSPCLLSLKFFIVCLLFDRCSCFGRQQILKVPCQIAQPTAARSV